MAKLLHLSRPNRRVSNIVRTWWAMRSQRRRRRAPGSEGGVPPAVVLNPGEPFWCPAEPWWVSVKLSWSYAAGGFPGGVFEIAKDTDGEGSFVTIGSLALSEMSSTSGGVSGYQFVEDHGTNTPALLRYRVRCVCGAVEGDWSNVCEVNIDNRNWAFP
jgi:hypothetical protein